MVKTGPKLRKLILLCLVNLLVFFGAFFLIEGLSSTILFVAQLFRTRPLAEVSHTRYDEQLGWVNLPNVHIADLYGPGRYFRTNSQAFRNDEDFTVPVPDNKIRAICSGDSFTLGYGVANDKTWCQQLSALDDRLQTVNMGQGGYGVDQAYLWYKRDGVKLEHHLHLFAFVTTDFRRMQHDSFEGYGKPLLKVRNDALIIDNVPVSRRAFYVPWLTQNRETLGELRTVQLFNSLFFQEQPDSETEETPVDEERVPEFVAAKILEDLQRLNAANDSLLLLVYLPTWRDYQAPRQKTEVWRRYVHLASDRAGILYIDLIDDFRDLPPHEAQAMFIAEGVIDYPGAAGHYTVKGNEYVARVLYEELLSFPEVSALFAEKKITGDF